MPLLAEVAHTVKSANAGASWVTLDIVFADHIAYEIVRNSCAITNETVARLYAVDELLVEVYNCDAILTIKATIPRATFRGGPDETDFDGVQQFAPLLRIRVPKAPAAT
jgi:hypothetical protein